MSWAMFLFMTLSNAVVVISLSLSSSLTHLLYVYHLIYLSLSLSLCRQLKPLRSQESKTIFSNTAAQTFNTNSIHIKFLFNVFNVVHAVMGQFNRKFAVNNWTMCCWFHYSRNGTSVIFSLSVFSHSINSANALLYCEQNLIAKICTLAS